MNLCLEPRSDLNADNVVFYIINPAAESDPIWVRKPLLPLTPRFEWSADTKSFDFNATIGNEQNRSAAFVKILLLLLAAVHQRPDQRESY